MDGPTHSYMLSTPGCWKAYGEVLAREYADPDLFAAAHRFSVDAYALQHPGDLDDRRARQSVWVHFLALHLVFEHTVEPKAISGMLGKFVDIKFPRPRPTPVDFPITHADLRTARQDDHATMARRWARSAYEAWAQLKKEGETFIRHNVL